MLFQFCVLILIFHSIKCINSYGFGPGRQDYGYVTVRPGAHMFWWLFYSMEDVDKSTNNPLIVWLNGGPAVSATGFGNFLGVGPIDENLNERNLTWVKKYNVLFIDSPVGTGFSYVDDLNLLPNNDNLIMKDLEFTLRGFYEALPEFNKTNLYLHGSSYGGKKAVLLAEELIKNQDEIAHSNLKGIIIENSFISLMHIVLNLPIYLYQMGVLDEDRAILLQRDANEIKIVVDEEGDNNITATVMTANLLSTAETFADGINIYNIMMKPIQYEEVLSAEEIELYNKFSHDSEYRLNDLMNGIVKESLHINESIMWGHQSRKALNTMQNFFSSVNTIVDDILNNTKIKVVVVVGNMDAVCLTAGKWGWVRELTWKEAQEFHDADRTPLWADNVMQGYQKHGGRLSFYWILNAGHYPFIDRPEAVEIILRQATGV